MKKLLSHITIISLAVAIALTSCSQKQDTEAVKEVPLKITYIIECSKHLLVVCDLVVTYKGDDGVNVIDTITAYYMHDGPLYFTWTALVSTAPLFFLGSVLWPRWSVIKTLAMTIAGTIILQFMFIGVKAMMGEHLDLDTIDSNAQYIVMTDVVNIIILIVSLVLASYDDALNSASHMYLKGGYIYAVATGNDAIDANGNLNLDGGYIYAAGREEAFDANEQYKLYVNSGVSFIAYGATMGALESGAQLNQTCYSASTYSGGSRYALYNGNQVESVTTVFTTPLGIENTLTLRFIMGLVMVAIVGAVILGGIKRIALFASRIVPVMVILYLIMVIVIMAINFREIPDVFGQIFEGAFDMRAGFGAFAYVALTGARRAAFVNEAGVGTASMMHGASKNTDPIREGLIAMLGPAIDSGLVCTLTGLTLIVSRLNEKFLMLSSS